MTETLNAKSLAQPFADSIISVISTMCFMECTFVGQSAKGAGEPSSDVVGMIGLASDTLKGSMALFFPEAVVLKVVSSMLGEEFTAITDEVGDAVGEIANMISGGARRSLGDMGISFKATIPSTIRGKCEVNFLNLTEPANRLTFETPAGKFWVEVAFSQ